MKRVHRWIVVGSGTVLAVLFAVLSRIEGLNEKVVLLLVVYAALFVAYVAALWAYRKTGRGLLVYVFIVAAVCRAVLIPAEPVMSTDVYRYLWEGRMIANGHNPFSLAPDSPELEPLRDRYYDRINHKHLKTIYPPVSQAIFSLAAWIKPVPQMQKLLFALFDLGVVLVLLALLRLRAQDPSAVIVYAWNPLVIFETAHSGHLEPVGIFFLVLGLFLLATGKKLWGFVALGLSFLAKYVAGVFVPYFLAKKKYAGWVAVMSAVVIAGYLPFAGARGGLLSSLKVYGAEWQFNGFIYKLLNTAVGDPMWTRRMLGLVLGLVVVYHSLKQRDLMRFAFVVIATALLVAPTLYPWYIIWVIPFLCFYRNRAWILFTGIVFLSYWVWEISAVGVKWELPWSLLAVEYIPFYGLLVFDAVRGRLAESAP